MNNSINFDDLASALLRDAPNLVRQWLPNGKLEGKEWCCGSIKGDKGRSLKVNIAKGTWADFAGEQKGGDLIGLYKEIHGLPSMLDAAKVLSGVSISSEPYTKNKKEIVEADIVEIIPEDAKAPILTIEGYKYDKSYTYRNENGQKTYIVQRYNSIKGDGKKEIRPWRYINGSFVSKQLPKPRPVFNLDQLVKRPNDPVLITEGEKTAMVGNAFSKYVSITWPMGAQNCKYVDWSVLKNRTNVMIIPDADKNGFEAAKIIGEMLQSKMNVMRVGVVDTSDKPEGWDIADASNEGMSFEDISNYVKNRYISYGDFVKKHFPSESKDVYSDVPDRKIGPDVDDANDPIGRGDILEGMMDGTNFTDDILKNPYFRFLGIRGQEFYFYIYKTGQVFNYSAKALGEESTLICMAPPDFWKEHFDGNYKAARIALVQISQEFRFDNKLVRKLGMWMDGDNPTCHLGEYILTTNSVLPLRKFKSDYVYEYSEHRVRFDRIPPEANLVQSKLLVEICSGSKWGDPSFGRILAGWMFMSLICASLRWRSHIYITGPAGSGKTWLLDNVIDKFFNDFKFKAASNSTEASIRQGLSNNMVPVIIDEAEAEDASANQRRKTIFELARFASASTMDTAITKGGMNGQTREYLVRSPFLFASINTSMEYADETRTTFLTLKPYPKSKEMRDIFKQHEQLTRKTMTPEYTCAMMRRALKFMPQMVEAYELFIDVCLREIANDTRQAEQQAYAITGAWFLENDVSPDFETGIEYIRSLKKLGDQRKQQLTSEEKLLAIISQIKIDCDIGSRFTKRSIGELALMAQRSGQMDIDNKDYDQAQLALRRAGMWVDNSVSPMRFYVMNESTPVRNGLMGTAFHPSWDKILSRVINAGEHQEVRYLGVQGPSVSIPLKAFIGEINVEKVKIDIDNPF